MFPETPAATPSPPSPSVPLLLRRPTWVLENAIHGRRSFKDLSARADVLQLGHADSSSAEAIATFFLTKQQEAVETRLREQHHLHRYSFRRLIHLLRFSAFCSWRASLLCASLFKNILDAKCSIARVEIILSSPTCRRQVDDLVLTLADLHELFSAETLARIYHVKLLLKDLEHDLKCYEEKNRVRVLSGFSAMKRGTNKGLLRCMPNMRAFKMCIDSGSNTQKGKLSVYGDVDGDADVDGSVDDMVGNVSGMLSHSSSTGQASARSRNAFSTLHKVHVRLHQIEVSMRAVRITFETLIPLLSGTHSQSLSQHHIEILRDDPLMFDGVAMQIADCHAGLSKHLDDAREQVLLCFCYINNARDLAYAL